MQCGQDAESINILILSVFINLVGIDPWFIVIFIVTGRLLFVAVVVVHCGLSTRVVLEEVPMEQRQGDESVDLVDRWEIYCTGGVVVSESTQSAFPCCC